MIIIEENTLIHVDSSSDVIEHYGVKGMKWGVRKAAKSVGNYGLNTVKSMYNSVRHPILYDKAYKSSSAKSYWGTKFDSGRSLAYQNNYIKAKKEGKKKMKSDIKSAKAKRKEAKKAYKKAKEDAIGRYMKRDERIYNKHASNSEKARNRLPKSEEYRNASKKSDAIYKSDVKKLKAKLKRAKSNTRANIRKAKDQYKNIDVKY